MNNPNNKKSTALRVLVVIAVISFIAGVMGGSALCQFNKSCEFKIDGQTFSIK